MILNPSPDLADDPDCRQLVDDLRDAHDLAKRLYHRAYRDGRPSRQCAALRAVAREIGGALFAAELNLEVLRESHFEPETPGQG